MFHFSPLLDENYISNIMKVSNHHPERTVNRLHVHVGVADLEKSVRFYSTLFGAQPSKGKRR